MLLSLKSVSLTHWRHKKPHEDNIVIDCSVLTVHRCKIITDPEKVIQYYKSGLLGLDRSQGPSWDEDVDTEISTQDFNQHNLYRYAKDQNAFIHIIFYVCWNQGRSSECIRIVPTHAGPKGEVSMGKQVETLPIEGSLHIKDKYVHLDSQCIVWHIWLRKGIDKKQDQEQRPKHKWGP